VTPNDRVLSPWVVEFNFHKSFHLPMFDKVLDLGKERGKEGGKERKREGYKSLLVSLAYLLSYAAAYGLHLNPHVGYSLGAQSYTMHTNQVHVYPNHTLAHIPLWLYPVDWCDLPDRGTWHTQCWTSQCLDIMQQGHITHHI